jgi:hypothetical protein
MSLYPRYTPNKHCLIYCGDARCTCNKNPRNFRQLHSSLKPQHGINCQKRKHRGGEIHQSDDDSPYVVDGVKYCGRCHELIP